MKALGQHYIAELSGCSEDILKDEEEIRNIIISAAIKANAEVRQVATHKFSPQGVSGVVVIAESHLSIHTWPEYGYAAIDIYTCGNTTTPQAACQYIAESLSAGNVVLTLIERGIDSPSGIYGQRIISQQDKVLAI